MITDESDLDVMQLSDSLFPTGLFATSNGLERMFLDGDVTTARDLARFARTHLEQQLGPCDCVALANAYECCGSQDHGGIRDIDGMYSAMRTVREAREASCRSGMQLARCVREFKGDPVLDWYFEEARRGGVTGAYPVSLAVCCNALGIPKGRSLSMLLYGSVAGIASAALRLGMIQHFEAQKVIHDLKPLMRDIAGESSTVPADEMWQFAPLMEIGQMRHEEMDARMFAT